MEKFGEVFRAYIGEWGIENVCVYYPSCLGGLLQGTLPEGISLQTWDLPYYRVRARNTEAEFLTPA
jgi:hypothetical protein